jgi:glycosyltransferase involved in cell wall biosynthesis
MKVAFDAKRIFNNSTGLGNYSRTIVENLCQYHPEHELHLYTPKITLNRFDEILEKFPDIQVHLPKAHNKLASGYWRSYGVKNDLTNVDLYHGLSNEIPISKFKAKKIVTIHDLIFKRYPEQYKFIDRMGYDFKFNYACNNSDLIIAVSEQTKRDIIKYYNVPVQKIKVLYQTCDRSFYHTNSLEKLSEVKTKHDLPHEYLLYVGTFIDRKNALTIIKALDSIKADTEIHLVMIGSGGEYKEKVKSEINKRGLTGRVKFLNHVDFEDLPKIYQMAKVFIYPSIFEGFGIPIIEALFSGTPVITSNVSCLPEAAGTDSILIDPMDDIEMGKYILKLLQDKEYYTEKVKSGLAYVQKFHEKNLTNQLHHIYTQL